MVIRPAAETDIPEIIALLKASLGESLMPKSAAFWTWKHIDNPFGVSPVLVAEENDKLVGVRAFMQWQWMHADKIYKAVRAVDTATHPDFQGRGVFKKLTLSLVEECQRQGTDFIFNTPNKSSKPGYIKMGWNEKGRLPIMIRPVLYAGKRKPGFDEEFGLKDKMFANPGVSAETRWIQTKQSASYLKWRYLQNPNVKYFGFTDESGGLKYWIIFRLKPGRLGTEFRICDLFLHPEASDRTLLSHIKKAVCESGSQIITYTGGSKIMGWPKFPVGPEITVRSLTTSTDFLKWNNWKPSLGDLEVF